MSDIALFMAGGSGNRMGQDIPKQFMHIDGAPVIIHTMKAFEQRSLMPINLALPR